ncbi:hypothetical protein O6H91_05G051800 [Diphasiastrum complanatum]|uniref:Uncharacterized protein n=1 Tax=Diphasiastrum complanatum TaxID=34168 RepID=A0ACC2DN91_DIPCM|nr:hypothetical protein O6H91_05G051800 [Diphasiastrum complanatum]
MSNFGQSMDGFEPNNSYPAPSFDEVASNKKSPYAYEANQLSSIERESSSRSRRSRVTDLVLRILAVLLSVIAFATMASDSKSLSDNAGNIFVRLKFSDFDSTKAVLAANVLVCVYSLAQTFGALISIIAGHSLLPTPISEFISLILDQIFAYLLLATSASGATLVKLLKHGGGDLWLRPSLCNDTGLSGFCTLAAASVSISFLTFAVVAISAVQSGYFLAKHIIRS